MPAKQNKKQKSLNHLYFDMKKFLQQAFPNSCYSEISSLACMNFIRASDLIIKPASVFKFILYTLCSIEIFFNCIKDLALICAHHK